MSLETGLPLMPSVILAAAAATAGVFACAYGALSQCSPARLEALAKESPPRTQASLHRAAIDGDPLASRYFAAMGGALVFGAVAGVSAADSYSGNHRWIALGASALILLTATGVGAALGRRRADHLLPWLTTILRPLELILAPLSWTSGAIAALWPQGTQPSLPASKIAEAEMGLLVDEQEKSGALKGAPAQLLRNVLEFSELLARDVMVPRTKVTALKVDTPIDTVMESIVSSGHSRYPVYREELNDVFGLVYAKDLFRLIRHSWRPPPAEAEHLAKILTNAAERRLILGKGSSAIGNAEKGAIAHDQDDKDDPTIGDQSNGSETNGGVAKGTARVPNMLIGVVRQPIKIVSESQPLSSLLREMRDTRQHLAVTIDEFGQVSGLVTLEDVLEAIVGDIQDEHDSDAPPIIEVAPDRYLADASVLVSDLSAYLGYELEPKGDYDTIGGLIIDRLGDVPAVGTRVTTCGLDFLVRESDEKKVLRVEIHRPPDPEVSGIHLAQG